MPDCKPLTSGVIACFTALFLGACAPTTDICNHSSGLCIDSLNNLSIERLRRRTYDTELRIIERLGSNHADELSHYSIHFSADGSAPYSSFMTSYISDGLNIYARVDIPIQPEPEDGYPVVVFVHGWVGEENAPNYDFGYTPESFDGEIVDRFVDEGFVVITPGNRGHGTVNGQAADGIEYLQAWDNGSYLMPSFYAIDLLNLIDGLDSFSRMDWQPWAPDSTKPELNLGSINLLAYSQGGDVALTALAVSGEGSRVQNLIRAASIWSGNIPDRFTQANTFGAMASSLDAFMSGDGSWTGSSIGSDGSINNDFIFAYPADWIGTLDTQSEDWTWQARQWSSTVETAVNEKYQQMYNTLNARVMDIEAAEFRLNRSESGKLEVSHPKKIERQMNAVGGFFAAEYLDEPLALHFSDRDYYSFPNWNKDLAQRINSLGGSAYTFEYFGNTHSLKRSEHNWFSPAGTEDGYLTAIDRDIRFFSGEPPEKQQNQN